MFVSASWMLLGGNIYKWGISKGWLNPIKPCTKSLWNPYDSSVWNDIKLPLIMINSMANQFMLHIFMWKTGAHIVSFSVWFWGYLWGAPLQFSYFNENKPIKLLWGCWFYPHLSILCLSIHFNWISSKSKSRSNHIYIHTIYLFIYETFYVYILKGGSGGHPIFLIPLLKHNHWEGSP